MRFLIEFAIIIVQHQEYIPLNYCIITAPQREGSFQLSKNAFLSCTASIWFASLNLEHGYVFQACLAFCNKL